MDINGFQWNFHWTLFGFHPFFAHPVRCDGGFSSFIARRASLPNINFVFIGPQLGLIDSFIGVVCPRNTRGYLARGIDWFVTARADGTFIALPRLWCNTLLSRIIVTLIHSATTSGFHSLNTHSENTGFSNPISLGCEVLHPSNIYGSLWQSG